MAPAADPSSALEELYESLRASETAPLWEVLDRNRQPTPGTVPHRWPWAVTEPLLQRAGELVSAEEAERRVLMLCNPATPGDKRAVGNLYAGIQLILPGETAPAHRHTAAALRFILAGSGATTVVDGAQVALEPLDLVLTPGWTWHDHVNETAAAMVWLDALDSPFVRALDAWFFDPHPDGLQGVDARPTNRSALKHAWAPIAARAHESALAASEGAAVIRYEDPGTGGDVLPTTRCSVTTVLPGGRLGPVRRVGSAVYCVAEGSGSATVSASELPLHFGDVFCVPSWCPLAIRNAGSTSLSLFTYDDEPVLQAFGLARSEGPSAR